MTTAVLVCAEAVGIVVVGSMLAVEIADARRRWKRVAERDARRVRLDEMIAANEAELEALSARMRERESLQDPYADM